MIRPLLYYSQLVGSRGVTTVSRVHKRRISTHFRSPRIRMNPDSTHFLRWIRIWIEKCATGSELKSSCERGFQSAIDVSLIAIPDNSRP